MHRHRLRLSSAKGRTHLDGPSGAPDSGAVSTHDRHSWLGRITQAGQVRIRRWMIARRGWPMPGDFDAMSADEFDAFVDRIGFDARIKQAIAQADTEAETPTHRRLPVR